MSDRDFWFPLSDGREFLKNSLMESAPNIGDSTKKLIMCMIFYTYFIL